MMSQEGTRDTTKMTFPTRTVRFIAKDLNRKDFLEKENKLLYNRINLFEQKVTKQDSIITLQTSTIKNDSLIFKEKDNQLNFKDQQYKSLEKDNKKLSNQKTFWKIATYVSIGLSIFIAVK